jgi:hypothetical protein
MHCLKGVGACQAHAVVQHAVPAYASSASIFALTRQQAALLGGEKVAFNALKFVVSGHW